MAKQYAYFIEGSELAIVEKDTTFDNNVESKEFGPGVSRQSWKSPQSTVADGIEIKYAYSPEYFIDETDKVDTQIDTYVSLDGLLRLIDQGDNNYSASPESLVDGSYIVLRKAGKWNGLHKVKAAGTGYITTYTKCSDSSTVQQSFEETPDLYYNVDVLNDEEDTIDLPTYLQRALVYYMKARVAQDSMDIKGYEYFMREYKKMIERYESTRISGPRIISPGFHSIR